MIWHPYTILKNTNSTLYIKTANKEFLYDNDSNEYIDAVSSWWISIHGHNHPYIIEKVKESISKLDHIILAGQTHYTAESLAKKLISFTDNIFHSVFYSDNGSVSIDIAIKIAIQYFQNLGYSNKKEIIHFSHSYHGDSIGAMSISGSSSFNSVYKNLLFESKEFSSPDCNNCPMKLKPESCSLECLDSLENYIKLNHENVSMIIIEPIVQAALGMKFYKKEVLVKLAEICNSKNILFVVDEIFTGFGRLGKNFAFQYANIKPDIITLAKGLTGGVLGLATTLVNEKVYNAFYSSDPQKAFYHGHTMTGNPSACAAALASIELYQNENRLNDIQKIEIYFKEKLNYFNSNFSDKIFNPRTIGSIFAFELGRIESNYLETDGKTLARFCLEKNVLIRPLGNTIYITPPYIISRKSLDKIFDTIEEYISTL